MEPIATALIPPGWCIHVLFVQVHECVCEWVRQYVNACVLLCVTCNLGEVLQAELLCVLSRKQSWCFMINTLFLQPTLPIIHTQSSLPGWPPHRSRTQHLLRWKLICFPQRCSLYSHWPAHSHLLEALGDSFLTLTRHLIKCRGLHLFVESRQKSKGKNRFFLGK